MLAETFPSLVFDDLLCVGFPSPGRERAWAEEPDDLEVLAEWCEDAETVAPLYPFPAPGGLLPWATSYQGDYFLWTTHGRGPEEWTVMWPPETAAGGTARQVLSSSWRI
ncbi:hypothetical protein ABTX99_20540 [Streptomyces flaveolus]|uniref:hypothetical protein n=1 Tax=Streptomyces flaveolus TaxID=67297 RepID=UPI003331CBBA